MAARLPPSLPLPQRFRTSSEAFRTSSALLPHFFRTSSALFLPHFFFHTFLPHFFRSGPIERHLTSSELLPHFFQKAMFYLPHLLVFNDNAKRSKKIVSHCPSAIWKKSDPHQCTTTCAPLSGAAPTRGERLSFASVVNMALRRCMAHAKATQACPCAVTRLR